MERGAGEGARGDLPEGGDAKSGESIEIWGDGKQTRSFLYIEECIEGTMRLARSDFAGPVNIGSEQMVTIDQLVDLVADIAGKRIGKRHVDGAGRRSGQKLRQSTDPREIELGSVFSAEAWTGADLCVD